jgi:hypothetical protein|tara:strand:- start:776 stop:1063 length:288 start_codon:yes stop_codon:yes gene_type:complete
MSFKLNKPSLLGKSKVSYDSTDGFRPGSKDEHNDINWILDNKVDMTGVNYRIEGIDNLGNSKIMEPNSGIHYFDPQASKVKEVKINKTKKHNNGI